MHLHERWTGLWKARPRLRWLKLDTARADIAPLVSSDLFRLRRGATHTGTRAVAMQSLPGLLAKNTTNVADRYPVRRLRDSMAFYSGPASPERWPGVCTTPTASPKPARVDTCTMYSHIPAMDKASQALAQGLPTGVPKSYCAFADHSGVPCSTLYHRARGRQSIQAKAQSQQYLAPFEEKAVVQFIL